MSDARRYAVWPDPRSRSRSRAYSRIKDRKSPIKGSRPSVPHGTNFSIQYQAQSPWNIKRKENNCKSYLFAVLIFSCTKTDYLLQQ